MATTVLLQGTGMPDLSAVSTAEQAQPPGTRVEWQLVFRDVTTPAIAVGPIQVPQQTVVGAGTLAGAVAALVNQAAQAIPALQGIPTWPGQPLAVAQGGTVRIRWVTDAPWGPVVAGVLAGLATTLVASGVFDIALVPAVALGAIVAFGVFALVSVWRFLAYVTQAPAQALAALGPAALWVGVGLLAFGLILWAEEGG
jgi:hypothetical protein